MVNASSAIDELGSVLYSSICLSASVSALPCTLAELSWRYPPAYALRIAPTAMMRTIIEISSSMSMLPVSSLALTPGRIVAP